MRIDHLFEAPIALHSHIGAVDDDTSSYRPDDRKMMASDKARAKISHVWRNSVCDFNVILLDAHVDSELALDNALYNHEGAYGGTQDGNAAYTESRILDEVKDLRSLDAINIVFTNNDGANRVPLTGWMIAHRAWHAFQVTCRGNGKEDLGDHLIKRIDAQYRGFAFDISGNYNHDLPLSTLVQTLGTTRSCRQKTLTNPAEIVPESFAQFILTGSVKFNELPPVIEENGIRFPCIQGNLEWMNREVKNFEKFLNDKFTEVVREAEGGIFLL